MPIYATSTYVQDELGKPRLGYEYARVSNPTRDRLEISLAALEAGVASRVFGSGMAAINAMAKVLPGKPTPEPSVIEPRSLASI